MDHHHHHHHHQHHHHSGGGGDANRRRKRPRDDSTEVIYEHDYDLMSTKRHASLTARSWLSSSMPSTASTKRRCPDDRTATSISYSNTLHGHSHSNHSGHNPSLALPHPPSPPTLYETWGSQYSQTNATLRECHFLRVDRHQRQTHVVLPMSFSLSLTNNSSPPAPSPHHHQPLPPGTQERLSGDAQLRTTSHTPASTSPSESELVQHQQRQLSPHDDEKVNGNSVPHGNLATHLNQSARTTQQGRQPHGF